MLLKECFFSCFAFEWNVRFGKDVERSLGSFKSNNGENGIRQGHLHRDFGRCVILGEVEMDRGILREIAGVVRRVPLFGDDAFQQSFTSEYNDTLLTTHLATITKGIQSANEILEKSQYLLDRPRKKFAS